MDDQEQGINTGRGNASCLQEIRTVRERASDLKVGN
jgi:hypothetical protein